MEVGAARNTTRRDLINLFLIIAACVAAWLGWRWYMAGAGPDQEGINVGVVNNLRQPVVIRQVGTDELDRLQPGAIVTLAATVVVGGSLAAYDYGDQQYYAVNSRGALLGCLPMAFHRVPRHTPVTLTGQFRPCFVQPPVPSRSARPAG
jgi:hypothetical protein